MMFMNRRKLRDGMLRSLHYFSLSLSLSIYIYIDIYVCLSRSEYDKYVQHFHLVWVVALFFEEKQFDIFSRVRRFSPWIIASAWYYDRRSKIKAHNALAS